MINNLNGMYTGIYRGTVINTKDPLNKNRIILKVPQIFGNEITNWAYPIIGLPVSTKPIYASFVSLATQTISDSTKNYVVAMETVENSYGINLVNPSSTVTALTGTTSSVVPSETSAMQFLYAGTYNIQISAQIYTTIGGNSFLTVDLWALQNGLPIPASTGQISVGAKNPYIVSSWNYILTVAAGDTVQFAWNVNTSTATSLYAIAEQAGPPYQPSVPSFTVSANLIGNYTPKNNDNVWVMFEGGDPNYPLWLGTF
jgi:hypothetical protein